MESRGSSPCSQTLGFEPWTFILSQLSTLDTFEQYFSKNHFNIILRPTHWFQLFSNQFRNVFGQPSLYSDWLRAGRLGFDSRWGQENFLFDAVSRPALGPTHPPIQWVPVALLWVDRETDHSPASSAKVKECLDLYLHSPICLHGVVLS
jgi:hypothetical protein